MLPFSRQDRGSCLLVASASLCTTSGHALMALGVCRPAGVARRIRSTALAARSICWDAAACRLRPSTAPHALPAAISVTLYSRPRRGHAHQLFDNWSNLGLSRDHDGRLDIR
ncbi:unnamed protein product [Urochloa humidicola]